MATSRNTRRIDPTRVPRGFQADPTVPPLRIAILRGEGDLVEEDVSQAFEALGHQVMTVRYLRRGGALAFEGAQEDLGKVADRVMRFGPHAIVCCNVEGIGLSGLFPALAEAEGIPLVAWLVDHPPRDMARAIPPHSAFAFIASYDRIHADSIRSLGYRHVEHLPLGTYPWRLHPNTSNEPSFPVGYAGNLFGALLESLQADLLTSLRLLDDNQRQTITRIVGRGIARFSKLNENTQDPWEWVEKQLRGEFERVPEPVDAMSGIVAAVVTHSAAARRRQDLIAAIDRGDTHVWGNGWEETVDAERCHAPVPYREIGSVYRACRVNLSIGHVQNLDSVTQRVFDVPAAGGFVLSDRRPSLGELFDIGDEIVVYDTPEEARELAERYARDHVARQRVVDNAKRRVLNEHTYPHRVETLTRWLLDTWPEITERPRRRKRIAIASGKTGAALLGTLCAILAQSAAARPGHPLLKAISEAPEGAPWLKVKEAAVTLARGDPARALELYEKATHTDTDPPPHHPGASDTVLFDAGRACAAAHGHASALPWFQRAAMRSPRHPLYWAAIAGAFLQRGDHARGRAALERALALSPGFPPATRLREAFADELAGVASCWNGLLETPRSPDGKSEKGHGDT